MNQVRALPLLLLLPLALVFFWFGLARAAQAQGAPEVQRDAEYTFGETMRFALRAKTAEPVTRATLFFTAPQLDTTYVVELEMVPSRSLSVTHEVPLAEVQLLPFTTVTYWWRLEGGEVAYDIPAETIAYVDNRFDWQELSGPYAIVHWTGEEVVVGQTALDVIARAWAKLVAVIPINPGEPFDIYVYPGSAEMRSALMLGGRDWVGASAHPEQRMALVTAVNPRTAELDLGRSIPHELTHLLLHDATRPNQENVPRWFEEGLATLMQATQAPDLERLVGEAIGAGETIPLATLCRDFPETQDRTSLAYAQSASVVGYIQTQYGNHALTEMIRAFGDGADCEAGVRRALDLSLADLEAEWLEAARPLSPVETVWEKAGPWLLLLGGGFVLMTLLLVPLRR
ncbi:MAG: hypothetical protein GX579_12280 [Chloroflexi bacterium]|nr:hypothetical protein [Chloroflexota bacterium]